MQVVVSTSGGLEKDETKDSLKGSLMVVLISFEGFDESLECKTIVMLEITVNIRSGCVGVGVRLQMLGSNTKAAVKNTFHQVIQQNLISVIILSRILQVWRGTCSRCSHFDTVLRIKALMVDYKKRWDSKMSSSKMEVWMKPEEYNSSTVIRKL
uniref:Uncharacterized protein n=1 Tax=Fusarium oxysporum (strain Fo5176) TaxID=660025 RepID=A0A0C4DJ88_FUSOF